VKSKAALPPTDPFLPGYMRPWCLRDRKSGSVFIDTLWIHNFA